MNIVFNAAHPRLYLYDDGLVRFATERYSDSDDYIDNKYIHLTNYAINRDNISKTDIDNENNDGAAAGGGCVKWTVHTLRKYLQSRGF